MNPLNENHLTEEQIILHYYGDAEGEPEIEKHLGACPDCRAEFARVQTMLKQIEPLEIPEPAAYFEEKTWLKLRDQLPAKGSFFKRLFVAHQKLAFAGTMALLLAVAFMAGRFWPRTGGNNVASNPEQTAPANPQRVVLVAVGD